MSNNYSHMYMKTFIAVLITGLLSVSVYASSDGKWNETPAGLPYYSCKGAYTSTDDPAFMIGNYRIKLNTHASGIYELISGERCWARFNADPSIPDYGSNGATVTVDNREVELVGAGSLASKAGKCDFYSGMGFTRYDYDLGEGLKCSRMLSVMPSDDVFGASPYFLVTITFNNTGSGTRKISYEESVAPNFVPSSYQLIPAEERPLRYMMTTDIAFRYVSATFSPINQRFIRFAVPENRSMNEFAPQSVFLYCSDAFLIVNDGKLKASVDFKLRPEKKHTVHVVIGFVDKNTDCKEVAANAVSKAENGEFGAYASMWKKKLPDFSKERNAVIRREMYRSAHALESSAVYSSYFKETFIPADFIFAYRFGENVSNRMHVNHVLQACYTNPDLAKSILRYVLKQVSFEGMIPFSNKGFGYVPSDAYSANDIQLDLFNAVSEYMRVTGDYAFLEEWMTVYPMENGDMQSVMRILENCFIYLRDNPFHSDERLARIVAYLPEFISHMEKSGHASEDFVKDMKKFYKLSEEKFLSESDYSISALPYLLDTDLLTNPKKREYLDRALDDDDLGIEIVPSLSSFDGIEASSLFKKSVTSPADSQNTAGKHSWALYGYFKLME